MHRSLFMYIGFPFEMISNVRVQKSRCISLSTLLCASRRIHFYICPYMCRHIRIQICNTSSFEAAPRFHFDCSDSENQQIFRRAKNRRMSFKMLWNMILPSLSPPIRYPNSICRQTGTEFEWKRIRLSAAPSTEFLSKGLQK